LKPGPGTIRDDGTMQLAARLIGLLGAIVVSAWFALGIHQAHEVAHATNVIQASRTLTATQARAIDSGLDSARTLDPDREVDILRARASIKAAQPRLAQGILERVVHAEPSNLEGWIWLAGAALGNPPVAHRALAQIDKLDPRADLQ
jgi:predicted Zn-dependent protease